MPHRRFILASPLALAACSSLLPAQKYVPRANWPLQPAPPAQTTAQAAASGGPVLLIRDITAAPGLDARGLRTLAPDGSLHTDYYNLWAVPPADAVTQALLAWCLASGMFSAVVTPGTRLTPGLILEGELTELLVDNSSNTAKAALTLVVIRPSGTVTGTPLPLAQQLLQATAPVTGTGPAAEAVAQNDAVAQLLTQAMALLARFRSL